MSAELAENIRILNNSGGNQFIENPLYSSDPFNDSSLISKHTFDDTLSATVGTTATVRNFNTYTTGKYNSAIQLSAGGHINMGKPIASISNTSSFTISVWFNKIVSETGEMFGFITDTGTMIYTLFDGTNSQIMYVNGVSTGTSYSLNAEGVWYHVVLVPDAGTTTTYVDGAFHQTFTTPVFTTSNMQFACGHPTFTGRTGEYIYEHIELFDRALVLNEIEEIYNRSTGAPIGTNEFDISSFYNVLDTITIPIKG